MVGRTTHGFGAELRRRRQAADLSQEELAERAGVSTRAVSDLERGVKKMPRRDTARMLADGLGLVGTERDGFLDTARGRQPEPSETARSAVPTGNLPVSPTPLVGRTHELAAVAALLDRADVRLVTLTGPGGVGKTRLALAAADQARDAFSDGVWFVDLAPLTDPALVAVTVARTLGVQEQTAEPLTSTLQRHARGRQLLLVLDNWEHLLEAATLVAGLLAAAPALKVLATSRTRLSLRGEHEVPVPPLDVPDPSRLPPHELSGYDAVRLFIARAVAAHPTFPVDDPSTLAVTAICARLDGLPLAIELAAARVALLPPPMLLARLERRLPLLVGGARDLPARQRTLRDAIAWSYDLLNNEERTLFRRLAVFVGGFSLAAAESVARTEGDAAALLGLEALFDASLLRRVDGPGDEARTAMLETVREFALEQLVASGEEEATRAAHSAFFVTAAENCETEIRSPAPSAALDRITADHENLRAAFAFLVQRHDPAAMRLAAALFGFWLHRGGWNEGRMWLEQALKLDVQGDLAARARALTAHASISLWQGDVRKSASLAEEAITIWEKLGDRRGVTDASHVLARAVSEMGDLDRALALLDTVLADRRERGDIFGVVGALRAYSLIVTVGLRDHSRSRAISDEMLALARSIGDDRGTAFAQLMLGIGQTYRSEHGQAAIFLADALALFRALGDAPSVCTSLAALGILGREQGDRVGASALLEDALACSQEVGDLPQTAQVLIALATIAGEEHDEPRAERLYGEAMEICRRLESAGCACLVQCGRAAVARRRGDLATARQLAREGVELAQASWDPTDRMVALREAAAIAAARGEMPRAARYLGAVAALREEREGEAMLATERAAHEALVADLRTAMGELAYSEAWRNGKTRPIAEIIAETQADLEPI